MKINSTQVIDTYAEAFSMWSAKVIITAESDYWALGAAQAMTGFATSVIGCKCEAGIDAKLSADQTPDGRPGYSILVFTMDKEGLGKRLIERIGQCVMTCPTTACFSGFDLEDSVNVGGALRYFGDGYQLSKKINNERFWRIPVFDGEFLISEKFGIELVDSGDFYIAFMYVVFATFSLRPLIRIYSKDSSSYTPISIKYVINFSRDLLLLILAEVSF